MIIMLQKKIENVYSGRRVVRYPSSVYFENETLIGTIVDIQDYGAAEVFELKRDGRKS